MQHLNVRFQKVLVEEPSLKMQFLFCVDLKNDMNCIMEFRIKDQALVDAVMLSAKHIPDRFLPDKAIDLVDEAASWLKCPSDSQPEEIDQLERKISQLEIEKVALSKRKR